MEKEIGIAVFDTGIFSSHIDLRQKTVAFSDYVGRRKNPYDDNGHGTHVAGIITGKRYGIAPECRLVVLKVLDSKGMGKSKDMLQAFKYVIENRQRFNIRAANISIGTGSKGKLSNMLVEGVEKMWDSGIVVVCAAGNGGPYRGSVTYPGVSKKVITVGAFDDEEYMDNVGKLHHNYSGRGPTSECVIKPDFLSYGGNVMSTSHKGGYCLKSGTSMATPKITAIVAKILEKHPEMKPIDVKMYLKEAAVKLNEPLNRQGFGLIDPKEVLKKI